MAPSNNAAWLKAPKTEPLQVRPTLYVSPKQGEVVIKNHAVAINPVDWLLKDMGNVMFSWLKYPWILGTDVAGEVVEVGSDVTRFRVGDRVVGQAVGHDPKMNVSSMGGFQEYTILLAKVASPISNSVSYESASVLPLGVSTAACGLFQKDQLALQHPTVPYAKFTGKTLLIWGGSTSVGSNAIQLAVGAGYEVITTASPRNFDYVKRLGASQVFDYNSRTIVNDIIDAYKGKTTAGALILGNGGAQACMDILHKCQGDKFISMAAFPLPDPLPTSFVVPKMAYSYMSFIVTNWIRSRMRGIRTNFIFGTSLIHNEVGEAVWVDFLPKALNEGLYIFAPDPMIVGHGLDSLQIGIDTQKKGVSAKKVVVTL